MASVTFPPAVGGDGSTVTDDANVTTGLANGGHRARFVPALAQLVAVAANAVASAAAALASKNDAAISETNAASSAASALTAPGTNATSTTSMAIGSGSKAFTLAQTGKSFVVGQWVSVTNTAAPSTQWMLGAITAFTPGTGAITVNVVQSQGSGTLTTWAVAAAAPANVNGSMAAPVTVSTTTYAMVSGVPNVFTNAAQCTPSLPSSPANGAECWATFENGRTNNTVLRNGQTIMLTATDFVIDAGEKLTWKFKFMNNDWKASL